MAEAQAQETVQAGNEFIAMTAQIVSAYVGKNHVQPGELPNLLASIHEALRTVASGVTTREAEKPEPAVNPKRSVTPDYIIDLFTGKKFKSLKRTIRAQHGMTPEQYRSFWGLASDYPMVAPNYAKARSELAKTIGLGQKRRGAQKRGRKSA
jgi:predicted transcriptional regulator